MSLDIYATLKKGKIKEYEALDNAYMFWTREERFKHCQNETKEVFHCNITHNLTEMASHVPILDTDLYHIMWRPEEVFTKSKEIKLKDVLEPLTIGFNYLISHENELSKYNPENGWGHYENFVKVLPDYIRACYKWPNAIITVSR